MAADLEELLVRHDLAGIVDAIAESLTICACATGDTCTRHTPSPQERNTPAHA